MYQSRGLTPELASDVARQLTAHDPLGAHARDELGIFEGTRARPIQAALASAGAFAIGAAPPAILAALLPADSLSLVLVATTLGLLAGLGALAARLGGAPVLAGTVRVAFWGAAAMGATSLVGRLFGGVAV
jgi:VIT1/CCC1 family predicted Fe2+/Mn2+ transporter